MMYVPLYLWAGLSVAMMISETAREKVGPVALIWCALIWPALPICILLDRADGEDRRR